MPRHRGSRESSTFDPLDVRQYTREEIEAFVEVAATYHTYVASHVFTDDAARIAVEAGVKSIEHGFLMSRDTMELMRDHDVGLWAQPLLARLQRWYTPFEVLQMATSINAELLTLAGPRHPGHAGPLGVIPCPGRGTTQPLVQLES